MANSPSFGNADAGSAMHWEVELKFPVADLKAIYSKLEALGAVVSMPMRQTDHYFNHPARDFSQTDEALRLRQIGMENVVTYKGPKIDSTSKTRKEIELPLPPGADVQARFQELLIALGFRYVAAVSKSRRKANISWQAHQVELALDDVVGVGRFLELEISTTDATFESAKSALQELAKTLDLGEQERRSYLELLLSAFP